MSEDLEKNRENKEAEVEHMRWLLCSQQSGNRDPLLELQGTVGGPKRILLEKWIQGVHQGINKL